MPGEQRQRQLPNDATLGFIEIMKLIHHHRADIREVECVGVQQAIQQHFGHNNLDLRVGVDATVSRNQSYAVAPIPPALHGILKFHQFLVRQGDQRRRIIDDLAGAQAFVDDRLGHQRLSGACRG